MAMFIISNLGGRLTSNSQEAITLQKKSGFGEIKSGVVVYSSLEAFYLIERGKAMSDKTLFKLKKEEKEKYLVFKNLRDHGYKIKTGLKYGADFRAYKDNKHADYIIWVIKGGKINPKDLTAKTRIAHSTNKKLILAIIDEEEDITYQTISWLKPQ